MQKNIKYFFLLFLTWSMACLAQQQSHENLLLQADQLFSKKKYTESYKIYSSLLIDSHKFTPQTLLKMAYIKEALGETTDALYFLNMFYEHFPDKKVFQKMKELAEKEKLEGYIYSDLEFFANIYRNYHDEIILGILAIVFLYFLAVATNKIFIKGISNTSPIFFILFLLLVAYTVNYGEKWINPKKEVCVKNLPLIMDAPSAGANVIGKLSKGTRVRVKDETDIWYLVAWGENQKGYVRKFNFQL